MHGKHIPMFVTVSTVQECCNKLCHAVADLVHASKRSAMSSQSHTHSGTLCPTRKHCSQWHR